VKYNGNRTLVDFVEFIHKNAQTKFDLAEYKKRAESYASSLSVEMTVLYIIFLTFPLLFSLAAMAKTVQSAKALVKKTEEQLNRHIAKLSTEEKYPSYYLPPFSLFANTDLWISGLH